MDAGLVFMAGLETPMLMRRNLRPVRSESSMLMVQFPFFAGAPDGPDFGAEAA